MTDKAREIDRPYFSEFSEWFESQHDCIPDLENNYEKGAYSVWELLYCPQLEKPSWAYIGKMKETIQSQSARIAELEKALLDAMVQINQLTGQYDTKQENTK